MTLSYAIAAMILGIGILAAWTWKPPRIPPDGMAGMTTVQVVKNVRPTTGSNATQVGRITKMVACQWTNVDTSAVDLLAVAIGSKYVLGAGRMEITYNSGAKVVLEGPAVYEVDGRNGGFLRLGTATFLCRATAEKKRGKNEKGPQAGSLTSPPKDSQFFRMNVPNRGGVSSFLLQDVDLVVMVDDEGTWLPVRFLRQRYIQGIHPSLERLSRCRGTLASRWEFVLPTRGQYSP